MQSVNRLIYTNYKQHAAVVSSSHQQLRDLIVCPVETPDSFAFASGSTVAHYGAAGQQTSTTSLGFEPTALYSGHGLLAMTGNSAEIQVRQIGSSWSCDEVSRSDDGALNINNSVLITASPQHATRRVLVSANDSSVKVYQLNETSGRSPDHDRAKRRRITERYRPLPDESSDTEDVEEQAVHSSGGGECSLSELREERIMLDTPANHTSCSPDNRLLCVVGDDNHVQLFEIGRSGGYTLITTFLGSTDASFSSDWKNADVFAVGSQDGSCNVYDVRNLPSASSEAASPRHVASLQATQTGPSGAVRKVQFSSSSDLLAFSEHQSIVQVVDARTFDQAQILALPFLAPPTSTSPRLARRSPDQNPVDWNRMWGAGATSASSDRDRLRRLQQVRRSNTLLAPGATSSVTTSEVSHGLSSRDDRYVRLVAQADEVVARLLREAEARRPFNALADRTVPGMEDATAADTLDLSIAVPQPWLASLQGSPHYASRALSFLTAPTANFPRSDYNRRDVLGLDFNEFGEKLFIATRDAVIEYDVNEVARRSSASFGFV